MKLIKPVFIFFALTIIHSVSWTQTTNFSVRATGFLHAKAKTTITQNTELLGSRLAPRSSFTYEIFLNSSFGIGNKLSTYFGLGVGYFNAAYKIDITDEFLRNNNDPKSRSFRVSSPLSNYFAFRLGMSKTLHISDKSKIDISLGGRTYFAEPARSEFGLGEFTSGLVNDYILITKENINKNNSLDFNLDFGLSYRKQIRTTPLYWSLGISLSKNLTELWSGEGQLNGDSGIYSFTTTNGLTFIGIEFGIIYQQKSKS